MTLNQALKDPAFAERLKAIGDAVRTFRAARNWTQGDLATESGLSVATICAIEGGEYGGLSLRNLNSVAKALGISLNRLWRGK